MVDVYQRWSTSNRQMLGLLGCLAVLKNAYRWGGLPTTQEDRQRTTMKFPDVIDRPITEVRYGFLLSLYLTLLVRTLVFRLL